MLQAKRTCANIRSAARIRIGCSSPLNLDKTETRGEDDYRNSTNKGEKMKKTVLSIALACVAPFAWGQVSETTTTTTTTEGSGTITEYTPGSQIILKESSGPRTYRFGKSVTYVTKSGKVLDPDVVKTKVRVGTPVHVHYVGTGDNMMVDRVIVDED
jgi:DNA helicase TIP49 (TBP-interacting protein)